MTAKERVRQKLAESEKTPAKDRVRQKLAEYEAGGNQPAKRFTSPVGMGSLQSTQEAIRKQKEESAQTAAAMPDTRRIMDSLGMRVDPRAGIMEDINQTNALRQAALERRESILPGVSQEAADKRRYSASYGEKLKGDIETAKQGVLSAGGTRESESALKAAEDAYSQWQTEFTDRLGPEAQADFKAYMDALPFEEAAGYGDLAEALGLMGEGKDAEKEKRRIMHKYGLDEETFEAVYEMMRLQGAEKADYLAGRFLTGAHGGLQNLLQAGAYATGKGAALIGQGVEALTGSSVVKDFWEKEAEGVWDTDVIGAEAARERFEETYGGKTKTNVMEFTGDVVESAGNMMPAIAVSAIAAPAGFSAALTKALNSATFGLSAAGGATKQALQEGANEKEAWRYGLASGMLEVLSEQLFAGIVGMNPSGVLDDVMARLRQNGTMRFLTDTLGEGIEEVVVSFLSPFIARATYDPDAAMVSFDELVNALASGVAMSFLMNGANALATGSPLVQDTAETTEQMVLQDKYGRVDEQTVATLGTRGSRTFATVVPEATPEQFAAFAAYNNAGREGKTIEEVETQYADSISEAQKYAAFVSGQNEARYETERTADEERTQRRTENLVVFSRAEAGIDYNDGATAKLANDYSEADIKALNDVTKALGLKLHFAEQVDGGLANGKIQNGVITIAKDAINPLRVVFGHEITHRLQELAPAEYQRLRNIVAADPGLQRGVQWIVDLYKSKGMEIDRLSALDEAVADHVGTLMEDRGKLEAFVRKYKSERSLIEWLRDLFRRIADALTGTHKQKADYVARRMTEALGPTMKAAVENVRETQILGTVTAEVERRAAEGKPVSATDEVSLSLKYDKEYMAKAEEANNKYNRVPKDVMQRAAEARQAIADIFNDPELAESLGLPPDIIGNTYIPNGSYSGTEENTTECPRTIAADALMDAVAEVLGRPLTVEDTIAISQEYWKYTDKPECLYCYVAMDRKAHREFMGSYLQQRDDALANIRSGMSREEAYEKFLDGRKDTKPMKDRFDMWLKNADKDMITPNDLASYANMEKALERNPALKAQINDALKYAQSASWAKKRLSYAAYNGHILRWKKARIDSLNSNYGLRMYSFSDFSPAFILENMQMVTDAAVRNLKMLAYTKELDFVRIFAKTGMNINISVFGYNDGNGGVAMDAMQGADWAEAQKLREQYDNVGCTFVATNDAQIEWALGQDWIDVVIPFHMVRTGKKVADYFKWKNYTAMSADIKNKEFDKAKNQKHILPPVHQNNKERYLQACKDNNLTPRFSEWVGNPNYMKLVNETRQSEAKSKAVQPIFDLDAAKASIEDMRKRGGYYTPIGGTEENMRDIAGEIARNIEPQRTLATGEAEQTDIRRSLKDSENLVREIARIQKEGAANNRSEAAIAADINAAVEKVYSRFSEDYGTFEPGERPVREAAVPQWTDPKLKQKVSQTVRTVMEAEVTPESLLPKLRESVATNEFSHTVYGDKQAKADAQAYIESKGWSEAYKEWSNDVRKGIVSKRHAAIGWTLYNNAATHGDMETAFAILNQMIGHQCDAAQAVQATRILKQMGPSAGLYSIQRKVASMQQEINDKYGGNTGASESVKVVEEGRDLAAQEIEQEYSGKKKPRKKKKKAAKAKTGSTTDQTSDETYVEQLGKELAKRLQPKPPSTKTYFMDVAARLRRFAAEKLEKRPGAKPLTATELLKDYITNQAEYLEAWEIAQRELRDQGVQGVDGFINSGIGVDANFNPQNAIFVRALVESAAATEETRAMISKQSALGFTNIAETIARKLISETGATGEMAQTIRDAAYGYVQSVVVESQQDPAKLVDSAVKNAMRDIGVKVSKVVMTGNQKSVSQAIVTKLIAKYGLGAAEATNVASIVGEHFSELCREYSQSKLESLLKTHPTRGSKTTEQKIAEFARLGAFDMDSRYNAEAAAKIFKSPHELRIDPELAKQLLNETDEKKRDAIIRDIYRDIGRQMPSKFIDKWNAWRYFAMLGNVRTHVRNIFGNLFFAPVVATKSLTAAAIEDVVYRVSGGNIERTKGFVGLGKNGRELLQAAWGDYGNVQENIASNMKYGDLADANQYIREGQQIFGRYEEAKTGAGRFVSKTLGRAAEYGRKKSSDLMEAEDGWCAHPHYAMALAQYCKANGITAKQIAAGENLDKARAYAIQEAKKATYRDVNWFSSAVSRLGRSQQRSDAHLASKAGGYLVEGVLPFRKTPANILVRGLEYSPAGLIKALGWDLPRLAMAESGKLKNTDSVKTAAEIIDLAAAGLTGTGLVMLGAFLAAQGVIRGHGAGDEKEREFAELMGHQAYSLELPNGTSITLDWLAPEVLPLFIGVNLYEVMITENEGITLDNIVSAASKVTEPMLEMSCLQSLNATLESVGYASSNDVPAIATIISSAATNLLTQALPTLFGQIERTAETERMTTYTDKNSPLPTEWQYTLGSVSRKLPGDFQQIPYVDAWGRTEATGGVTERALNNFLNPAYMSKVGRTTMEIELLRLYDETGENVMPSRAGKYFTVKGERIDLDGEEYVKYATTKGQTAYRILTDMVGTRAYASLDEETKVKAVKSVYDYANAVAKAAVSDYELSDSEKEVQKAAKECGVSTGEFLSMKALMSTTVSLKDENGETISNSKSLQVMEAIYDAGLVSKMSTAERKKLFDYIGIGKTVQGYNKALVEQKLKLMRKKGR